MRAQHFDTSMVAVNSVHDKWFLIQSILPIEGIDLLFVLATIIASVGVYTAKWKHSFPCANFLK